MVCRWEITVASGSPPRMRGKGLQECAPVATIGITPAYAGKSRAAGLVIVSGRDHPRVCGEKYAALVRDFCRQGSPPRMRGKDDLVTDMLARARITPAYAGKSCSLRFSSGQCRDHPRVCGEKENEGSRRHYKLGSPPRMRGKVVLCPDVLLSLGITPAYAGKRPCIGSVISGPRDHPRVCGEKHPAFSFVHSFRGSPPRMRGKGKGVK